MTSCIHHWVIEEAGREVEGRCKHCGEVKMFLGYTPHIESMTGISQRGQRFSRTVEDAGAARRRGAKHGNATRKARG